MTSFSAQDEEDEESSSSDSDSDSSSGSGSGSDSESESGSDDAGDKKGKARGSQNLLPPTSAEKPGAIDRDSIIYAMRQVWVREGGGCETPLLEHCAALSFCSVWPWLVI
jgi:hypothetical protein